FERHLLFKITKIIHSVVRAELKRLEAKKPLPSEKQEKMAIGFTKYRIMIERIEAEAHKLLCDLSVPTRWFSSYKAFTRECCRTLKKYYGKTFAPRIGSLDPRRVDSTAQESKETLEQSLNKIISKWQKEDLKEDVLLKLKEKIVSVFVALRLKVII
ncbi:MAG: hypothetical protein ACETVX_06955, partial [bacterium]